MLGAGCWAWQTGRPLTSRSLSLLSPLRLGPNWQHVAADNNDTTSSPIFPTFPLIIVPISTHKSVALKSAASTSDCSLGACAPAAVLTSLPALLTSSSTSTTEALLLLSLLFD